MDEISKFINQSKDCLTRSELLSLLESSEWSNVKDSTFQAYNVKIVKLVDSFKKFLKRKEEFIKKYGSNEERLKKTATLVRRRLRFDESPEQKNKFVEMLLNESEELKLQDRNTPSPILFADRFINSSEGESVGYNLIYAPQPVEVDELEEKKYHEDRI